MTQLDAMPPEPTPPSMTHYTPTEKRLLEALSDGEKHLASDLLKLLNDDMTKKCTLSGHIGSIRKKLPKNEFIVCEFQFFKMYYRHVNLRTRPNPHR